MINAISAADIAFIMSSSTSAWLLSPSACSPQKQNGWTLRFCFWEWIMWKLYNKTIIEFGFRMIFNNYSPKAKWIFTNIHEPEANNCFSIITQVIIEIPKQRNVSILPQFAVVDNSSYHAARINVSRNASLNSRSEEKHFLWRSYRVKTNQNVVSWSVLLSTMGTLHYSFPK